MLRTQNREYPFVPGTAIIVPPGILYGSSSANAFRNISVCGEWAHYTNLNAVTVIDNAGTEGKFFAEQLYANRYGGGEYLSALSDAFILFLLRFVNNKKTTVELCINNIIKEVVQHACDADYSITRQLSESGYAEDYIRQQFKKCTGYAHDY